MGLGSKHRAIGNKHTILQKQNSTLGGQSAIGRYHELSGDAVWPKWWYHSGRSTDETANRGIICRRSLDWIVVCAALFQKLIVLIGEARYTLGSRHTRAVGRSNRCTLRSDNWLPARSLYCSRYLQRGRVDSPRAPRVRDCPCVQIATRVHPSATSAAHCSLGTYGRLGGPRIVHVAGIHGWSPWTGTM